MDNEDFKFELVPFRTDSYNNFLMFGYPVFGGWLPKLAFETSISYDDPFNPKVKTKYKTFIAEWFLRGYIILYRIEEFDMFGGDGV
jgi:hypothetical protein